MKIQVSFGKIMRITFPNYWQFASLPADPRGVVQLIRLWVSLLLLPRLPLEGDIVQGGVVEEPMISGSVWATAHVEQKLQVYLKGAAAGLLVSATLTQGAAYINLNKQSLNHMRNPQYFGGTMLQFSHLTTFQVPLSRITGS